MPQLTPTTLLWILIGLCSVVILTVAIYVYRTQPEPTNNTWWLISADRLALLLEVEARADDWDHFLTLPDHDPRLGVGLNA